MEISGSVALVTGAASGIGAAVARQLADAGATVVVADVQDDKGQALAEEIGGVFAHVDVTDTDQIKAAVDQAAGARRRCGSWSTPPASARLRARSAATARTTRRTTSSSTRR